MSQTRAAEVHSMQERRNSREHHMGQKTREKKKTLVTMVFRCIVSNCKNKYGDKAMHVFPKDLDLFKIWSEKSGRADIKSEDRTKYRICDVHFSEDHKFVQHHKRTNLKPNAVPSLFLPDQNWMFATQSPSNEATINVTEDADQQIFGGIKRPGSPVNLLRKKLRASSKFQRKPGFHIDIRRRTNLLKVSNTTRESHLDRRARKCYCIAKNVINIARKLNRQNATNKEHIRE